MGAEPSWWTDQSSKLAGPAKTRVGGFDSHTLPPAPLTPSAAPYAASDRRRPAAAGQ
jgi:hypothetical protein